MATPSSVSTLPPPVAGRWKSRSFKLVALAILIALLTWSWIGTEMNLGRLLGSAPKMVEFLRDFFPPNLKTESEGLFLFPPPLQLAGEAVAVTLQIALLGTAMGTVVALMLGLLGAERLTPHWLHHSIKIALAMLRAIPVVLLAFLFFYALGFGALPGVVAIAIHSTGMLGKLFAEEFEGVDRGVWEAMDSAGANWLQKVRYAVWPQVAPQICSLTLFRLEMNLRDSAVLGFVGIVGLGKVIDNYRKALDWTSVCTMVIITMLVVVVVDQISYQIRRRLK